MPFKFTDVGAMMPRPPQAAPSNLGNLFMEFAAQQMQQKRAQEQAALERSRQAQQYKMHGDQLGAQRRQQDQAKAQWDATFGRQGEVLAAERAEAERQARVGHMEKIQGAQEQNRD
jgi:hypothetical protein